MTAFLSNFSACVGGWKKYKRVVFFAIITGVANPDLVGIQDSPIAISQVGGVL